ncbi:transglycosylase domain-containing protein [Hutsoniella sourekii]|uniref:transglycosylase domain-containing protein n=1 Tax=Hutsoniella sourekii TaxID=87650 RepID=UPI0004B9AAE8|nr:PBP1A family penicillin-binding protein [Hutsoniella sourekii]
MSQENKTNSFPKQRLTRRQQMWQGFKNLWTYYRGWKWLIFITMSLSLALSTYLVVLAKTTSVNTLQEALVSKTTIYDYQDQVAGTMNGQKGTYVDLSAISDEMKQSVVTTEDKRFYQHGGFDTIGMGRAFVRLLLNRDTSGGGGSTITQQLAKNAFLSLDQTFQRKLKELFLSLELEKEYDKDQILEMYLNHAYFGNGVWGVEDAAQAYFGHSAASLNWNESMVLTGMLKGPSIFNPVDDYQAAIDRRNVVADLLGKEGLLSPEDVQYVQSAPINVYGNFEVEDDYQFPYYFDAVIDEASRLAGIPEDDLIGKGYQVFTNLNPQFQSAIDESYQLPGFFPDSQEGEPLVQSASVVIDPQTGGIAAVYGGRGEYVYRGFNRAVDMRRAPGSTIKPLAIYTPALEAGYKIHSTVPDQVKSYDGWQPENYNHYTEPSGETSLYYALAQSKNTTAVHLLDELGIDKAVEKLRQFGIPLKEEDKNLTLALGALSKGVTPLELANAYSAFANQGIRRDSFFIRKILDAAGNVVYQNEKPAKHMVMTKNIAADMTSMMLDSYGGYGTGYGAGPDFGQLAGKTGSTETTEGSTDTRDRWMVGYTPDFVIVSWVGLDEIGDQSLDQIMPSGMGQLFNYQTTQLMTYSNQTPFNLLPASAMEESTNSISSNNWQDQTGQLLDQASQWVEQELPGVLQEIESNGRVIVDELRDWVQFNWPFN